MKISKYLPLLLALLAVLIGYIATACSLHESCLFYSVTNELAFTVIKPLKLYGSYALIPSVLSIFLTKEVFQRWAHFAQWWLAISVVLIFLTPTNSNYILPFFDLVKEDTAKYMAILFTLISLYLFARPLFSKK